MLWYLATFLIGGLAGIITMALMVATSDRRGQHVDETRTASHAYEPSSWAIAHHGAITTESQLGKFSVTRSPAR